LWHEETGLLVGIDDHAGMAVSAIRLLEDQELAEKLVHQGLQECSKYTAEKERRTWIQLYQTLRNENSSSTGAQAAFYNNGIGERQRSPR
jgi:glycosyltransferase involved in cell wall biosynthesis